MIKCEYCDTEIEPEESMQGDIAICEICFLELAESQYQRFGG